ncbi:MAG TPA: DNA-3-methyladenine glycosylase I [Candidatus Woesearchaeota archaeon]|jgi:DNA-3-methyladenine glycosylase I|nr:DNA-3-methyladenine glycosylase I [Candidatus Woesearchaeota archaeon]HJO01979.1 DNA-3-methyladenine glycosylase I [Candidatus Woesearchaeota archaeon]|tara:strand:- start:215 stop:784 length:570 start_codon:yes stop_codon:yes gene_type:complete
MAEKIRCGWPGNDSLMVAYHDEEWGVPVHDDRQLFEKLILDSFQAGLSWSTILKKRKNFKKAFDNFNVNKISNYDLKKKNELMNDAGIIRNRLKIEATVINAQKFLEVKKEFGSFDRYIWQFVNHKTIINKWKEVKDIPASTKESDAMSKDLKERGFKFVGATICYAFMQAVGMVNDHPVKCFRYDNLK